MVAPKLAKMFRAAWLGPDAPDGIARMGVADLLKLWRRRTPLIWHARRNNEMIAGVLLRSLGWPLKLVFTSAAQRHHSWITRWLIRRMDAIIATSAISASFLKRKATVIPHGVDTDRYAPPADRAAAFAEAGLPGRYAIGCFGRVRAQKGSDVFVRRDVPAAAALSRFHRRHGRRDHAGADGVCQRSEKADRGRGPAIAHRHDRRIADRGGAALVPAADDLRLHLAQRRFWVDADRGDVGRRGAGGVARGRRRTRGRGRRDRRADAAGRCRCAGGGAGAVDARSGFAAAMGERGAGAGAGEIQPGCGSERGSPKSIARWSEPSLRRRTHRDRRLRTGSPAGLRPPPPRYRSAGRR